MRLFILNKDEFGMHVAEIAKKMNLYSEIYYLDDTIKDNDVLDFMNDFVLHLDDDTYFFSGFENDTRRCEWFNKLMELGANIPSIIDPTAKISPSARILPGCLIEENAVIENNCLLKTGCYIKANTIVKANTKLEINGMAIGNIRTH